MPENSKKAYGDVIKGLEKNIRSICDVLSKFIHETDDVLINVPFHKDLEFLYLSTLSIITYLAKKQDEQSKTSNLIAVIGVIVGTIGVIVAIMF